MASHGYHVWPVRIQLKPNKQGELKKAVKGLPDHWQSGGLTDPEAIKAQWMTVRATGYMIACGPSRITVVDTDTKNGVNGNQNYLNAGGVDGASFIVQTWSGGHHRYYQSAGFGNTTGRPQNVDVKGIGGGVFGPGSIVLNQHGEFAGQYIVCSGVPDISGLTAEPANLPQITQTLPKVPASKVCADELIWEQLQPPPMTVSRARQAVANKVNEIRSMKNVPNSGMRYRIMGAALLLGGLLHADLGYDENDARNVLLDACDQVFGAHNDDDENCVEAGLYDGQHKKPIPVYPDPLPPEQADPLGVSGIVLGASDDRIADLEPYLNGTYQPPLPDVGAKRTDGIQMLYSGRWHAVAGLTESGKSLFAIWHAVEVIANGGTVVYLHFEETDPRGTLERLQRFGRLYGLDNDTIRKQFFWLSCEKKWSDGALAQTLSRLPQPPALVVLDGINAAVAQHGEEVMHPKSVGTYRSLFVKPAVALGAAVLSLGHPVKDRQRQGERHYFGSTAWLDEIDGVAFRLVASSNPIAKGRSGSSALSSVKDRYSEVKRWGMPDPSKEPGWTYLGQFVVDDRPPEGVDPWRPEYSDRGTTAFVAAPRPKAEGAKSSWLEYGANASESDSERSDGSDDDETILRLVAEVIANGHPASRNAIEASAKGMSRARVRESLTRLTITGRLTEGRGQKNSRVYGLVTSPHDPH